MGKRHCFVGVWIKQEVEAEQGGRNGRTMTPTREGSFRVDQQATLDANESGVSCDERGQTLGSR